MNDASPKGERRFSSFSLLATVDAADMKLSRSGIPARGTLTTIPTPLSAPVKLPVDKRPLVTEVIENVL